jgi:WS/DGAT/MGAT family acyltransferase
MHVTLCAVLDPTEIDGGYSFERMRTHIRQRVPRIPAFTRRLVPLPLGLHHPLWVDDPAPDLDHHVRRAALPHPGDDRALARFTAQIAGIPLDRTRPLWEIWLLEGLEHGRIALLAKVHHAALDGVAGVESLVTLFDLERAPAAADADDASDTDGADGADDAREHDPAASPAAARQAEEIPSDLELLTYGAVSKLRGALDFVPLARRTASSVLAVRSRRARPDAASGATPLVAPATPFNGTITGSRRVAFARVSLDEIKQVKRVVPGATVNDVILTVCAGAMRTYLLEHDELPADALVAACPINVRTDDQRSVAIPYDYAERNLTYGYATTIHKAQGATVDRCFVYVDETTSREHAYTALSRGRDRNDLYINTQDSRADVRHGPELDPDTKDRLRTSLNRRISQLLATDQTRHRSRDTGMGLGR